MARYSEVTLLIVLPFWLKFYDVTVTLSLTVLSSFFLVMYLDTSLRHAKFC